MVETLSVSLSGPAFSWLLYENVRTRYDQEGFLLGEIIEKKTNSITDNDEQVTKIDRIIKVNSTIPCPKLAYFYDAAGNIDEGKISSLLGNKKSDPVKVVAWYKFKHSNAFKMTIREKIIHKQLCQYFAPTNSELFTCCLLTTNSSQNGSTHLYSQTFLKYSEPSYQMLPMHIVNLSDPNNSYKSMEPPSDVFSNLVKSLHIDKEKTQGINVITQINEELQDRTEKVAAELTEAEKRCYDLEKEVGVLRDLLRNKEMGKDVKMLEVNRFPCPSAVENGDGDVLSNLDISNVTEGSPEVTKGNRGRKKSARSPTVRNSCRSPVKVNINHDNIVNSRTRNRTPMPASQKK